MRVPASFCGIFGFRPSHDVVSTSGVIPMAQSFDTVGKETIGLVKIILVIPFGCNTKVFFRFFPSLYCSSLSLHMLNDSFFSCLQTNNP